MASSSMRENGGLIFKPKTSHFFKIIVEDTLLQGRLSIPRKFVRKFGDELANSVFLKVPSGTVWKVELAKHDGETWLQTGWQEFAHFYSLSHGSFVVFEYRGNCEFHVIVFDKSASEIDYPFNVNNSGEKTDKGQEFKEPKKEPPQEESVSVEILDDCLTPCQKTRDKSPLSCPQPSKKMKSKYECSTSKLHTSASNNGTQSRGMKIEQSTRNETLHCPTQQSEAEGGDNNICSQEHGIRMRTKTINSSWKQKALKKASAFKSENPYFVVAMQPSYVNSKCDFSIPSMFAKRYFKAGHGEVRLQDPERRAWTINCRISSNGRRRAKFCCNSWMAFARGNNLKIGDVCIFELIKSTEIQMLKVIII